MRKGGEAVGIDIVAISAASHAGFKPDPKRRSPTSAHLGEDYEAIVKLGASPQSLAGWDTILNARENGRGATCRSSGTTIPDDHCRAVAALAKAAWRCAGKEPKAVAPESPLTIFVATVLSRDADYVSRRLRARK